MPNPAFAFKEGLNLFRIAEGEGVVRKADLCLSTAAQYPIKFQSVLTEPDSHLSSYRLIQSTNWQAGK